MKDFLRQTARHWLSMLEDHNCLICHDPLEDGLIRQFLLRDERPIGRIQGVTRDFGEALSEFVCTRCSQNLPFCFGTWERIPESTLRFVPVFRYEGDIREALLRLKFGGETVLAELFALLAGFRLRALGYRPRMILPVPLGRERKRMRGYNQANLIAQSLGRILHVPAEEDCLLRKEDTKPQTEMRNRAERMANVNDAFVLERGAPGFHPREGEILLLDDVSTSGATFRAAAGPLLRAGFHVRALCIAREAERNECETGSPGIHKNFQIRYDRSTWNA